MRLCREAFSNHAHLLLSLVCSPAWPVLQDLRADINSGQAALFRLLYLQLENSL